MLKYEKMKKILSIIITVVVLAVAGIFIAGRFFGVTAFQSMPVVGDISCAYPVAIGGDSMEPAFESGSRMVFNQCVEDKENLPAGTVIVFKEGGTAKIYRIKDRFQKNGEVFYRIGRDNRGDETTEVSGGEIIAIWNEE